jgi:hypothetical protein
MPLLNSSSTRGRTVTGWWRRRSDFLPARWPSTDAMRNAWELRGAALGWQGRLDAAFEADAHSAVRS